METQPIYGLKVAMPQKLPPYIQSAIPEAFKLGTEFLYEKYGEEVFKDVTLIIRPNARGKYYPNGKPEYRPFFGKSPIASISCESKLFLYEKKTLGKYNQGLSIGYTICIAATIIHELTHHVQLKRVQGQTETKTWTHSTKASLVQEVPKRPRYSEVETTANEIEFLKNKFPEWHKLLMIEEAPVNKVKPPKEKIVKPKKTDDTKIQALQNRIAKWEKKQKACTNALKKLNAKLKYYERKKPDNSGFLFMPVVS